MELELVAFMAALLAAGSIAGITAGLFGNGGGFVVVPALLAVFPFFTDDQSELMRVAIGTSLASIIISSARSVQAHKKKGAVDFQVLKSWSIWLLVGVGFGVLIASQVHSENLVVIFASGVLVYSIYFLFPHWFKPKRTDIEMPTGPFRAALATFLGGFSSLLGIGGGTITVITMVMCHRTVHQAVATAAGVGFIIGLPGAIGFAVMGFHHANLPWGSLGYINIPALIAIAAASIITAPIGAKWAHNLNELHLKRLFGVYLIIVSANMYYKALV
ncbi:sulfite exporter TauE/SafE family protein [Halioxenophilus sp. WMMB6]|uniref:sulfite exporter TauE/SafE family protein n=1 Tax=Halioxenophilus sp. WMMB6 TaxID=3073815 RepID=UPI00295EC403|nr:sulfite exporter TauE/SafE family protein [Halioxenophilus sp. WMMB6]